MKSSSVSFAFALLSLVVGAAAEELLPKFSGVGFPVLLASAVFFSTLRPVTLPVLYALAAGAAEDALSGLPFLTSASFFLVMAALSRWTRLPGLIAVLAYPVYRVWLCLWCSGLQRDVFARLLAAFPLGLLTFLAVGTVLWLIRRKAAVDEED